MEIVTKNAVITISAAEQTETIRVGYVREWDPENKTYWVKLLPDSATPANEQCGRDIADLIEQMEIDALEASEA